MSRQVPRGSEDLVCPFHKKPMSEVCHKCPLWYELAQRSPAGERTTVWDCALSFSPTILQYIIREQVQMTASIQDFRNRVVEPVLPTPDDVRKIDNAQD